MLENFGTYLELFQKVIQCKKKRTKFLLLKENIYNLISNLLTDEALRRKIGTNMAFLEVLVYRLTRFDTSKDMKCIKSSEALLGVFVNILHEQNAQIIQNFDNLKMVPKLQVKYISRNSSLILITSRKSVRKW